MAAQMVLPAIGQGSQSRGHSPNVQQQRIPSPPMKSATSSYLKPIRRSMGKKEREMMMRQAALRAQQPELTKKETTIYRNTYMHNLCLDMLQEGYHRSFSELFALVKQQHMERERAGPESALWNAMLLDQEHEKLDMLKVFLTKAETALRTENYENVYYARHNLAKYFQGTGDKWLADHFFESCLEVSENIKGDLKFQAEAHCNLGLALEESGEFFSSADQFENFHQLSSENKEWKDSEGRTLHSMACNHLMRVYTVIGNKLESNGDGEASLSYLVKAYNMAKEGGDVKLEGEASYRLGLAYEKAKDSETALLYLNGYLEICKAQNDDEGTGLACEAIAKSFESQGKVEDSIKYLQTFCEVAERSKQEKAYSKACSDLGAVFNSLGRYEEATDYFSKAYNLSRALNDKESIKTARVQYGVAQAHHMLQAVANHINLRSRPCIERLVDWKSARSDEFAKPLPEKVATPEPEVKEPEKTDQGEHTQEETTAEEGESTQEGTAAENTEGETAEQPTEEKQES